MQKQIDWLEKAGQRHIYIIDNASNNPQLIDYYENTPHTVIKLTANIGYKALWDTCIHLWFKGLPYVYTDPDILPVDNCPHDVVNYFHEILKKQPHINKVGFALKIDDIPDYYPQKKDVIKWETKFWCNPISDNLYKADIDTTFALYRANSIKQHYRESGSEIGGKERVKMPNVRPDPDISVTMDGTISVAHGAVPVSKLAIYSTFCGSSNNIAWVIERLSGMYPCFMYSNNAEYLQKAAAQGWTPILLTQYTPPSHDVVVSATQAKYAKSRPELLPELQGFDYLFYLDSKVYVDETRIAGYVQAMTERDSPIAIRAHPFLSAKVWDEYNLAMKLPRYAEQKDMAQAYITWRLSDPAFRAEGPSLGHYWTSAILRNMRHGDICRINEMWASDIAKCGIECQVSFFFVAQTIPNLLVLPQDLYKNYVSFHKSKTLARMVRKMHMAVQNFMHWTGGLLQKTHLLRLKSLVDKKEVKK